MKKFLKITGIVILVLLIAIIAVPYFFKDDIVEMIKTEANAQLNASLEFGDVSLSLISNFPNLSLGIEDIKLTGVDEFAEVDLVQMGEFKAKIDLFSVFGDSIRVKAITLTDANIDVRVLADGKANYDIAKESEETAATGESEGDGGGFNLRLDEYSLNNVNLLYDDQATPMRLEINELNHSGSGDFSDVLYTLNTITTATSVDFAYDGVRYMREVETSIEANLEMNMEQMKFTFVDNKFGLNEMQLKADGYVQLNDEDIEMDLTYGTVDSKFEYLLSMVPAAFADDLAGVEASGDFELNGYLTGSFSETSMPGFGTTLTVDGGRFNYPDLPSSVENVQINMAVDAADGNDLDKMKIDIDRCYVELAGNPVDLKLKLRTPMSDPEIDCDLKAKLILDDIGNIVPLEEGESMSGSINADLALHGKMSSIENEDYEAFQAEGQIIMQQLAYQSPGMVPVGVEIGYFNFSPQFLELSQFEASAGATSVSADGKIDNYMAYALRDELLTGTFNLRSDFIDLNEFMMEADEPMAEETGDIAAPDVEEPMSIIQVPTNIDFTLNSTIGKIRYEDVDVTDVNGQLEVKEGVVDLRDLDMKVLDGTVTMSGQYATVDPSAPTIDMLFDIRDMDIKKSAEKFYTIEKMAPLAKSCQGKFSTDLNFAATLDENMEPIEESMVGDGGLQTKSVYIEGFKPLNEIASVLGIDRLSKQTIEDINLSYQIKDGKAIVEPFDVKLDDMPATISGHTAIVSQEMEYDMTVDVPFEKFPSDWSNKANSLVDQINKKAGTNLSVGDEVPVNLKITGTAENPKVATNYGEVAKGEAGEIIDQVKEEIEEKVEEVIEEVKDDAKEKAREEADKILADAQKEADKILTDAREVADDAKDAAYDEAQKVEDSAKNALERVAKKKAADEMRKAADKAHKKAMDKAQEKADKVLADAEKKADDKINSVE